MREVDIGGTGVGDDPNQAATLGALDGVGADEFGHDRQRRRLGHGQQLQRALLVVGQPVEPAAEQWSQFRGDTCLASQLPDVVDPPQGSRFQRAFDEVPDEQRIAARGLPHQVGRQLFEVAAERRLDEFERLFLGERGDIKPGQIAVLPQRGNRVGDRLTAAGCRDNAHGPLDGELMKQGRGQVVDKVDVVDPDDGKVLAANGVNCVGQHGHRVGGHTATEQVREHPKRHLASRLGPGHPHRAGAQRLGGHPGQRGLADACVAKEQRTAGTGPTMQRRLDRGKFLTPPQDGPGQALPHGRSLRSQRGPNQPNLAII